MAETTRPELAAQELERRWSKIQETIMANAGFLRHQGVLVWKPNGRGNKVCIRFIDRSSDRPIHRTIFLAWETETLLVARAKRLLRELRRSECLPREVRSFSRLAGALQFLCDRRALKHKTGKPRRSAKR
jgi:hypothetical protein